MMVHNRHKILSDMPKFIFYLYENFSVKMTSFKMWPQTKQEEVIYYLEWYSYKFRPFMWEFYGVMIAAHKTGLSASTNFQSL